MRWFEFTPSWIYSYNIRVFFLYLQKSSRSFLPTINGSKSFLERSKTISAFESSTKKCWMFGAWSSKDRLSPFRITSLTWFNSSFEKLDHHFIASFCSASAMQLFTFSSLRQLRNDDFCPFSKASFTADTFYFWVARCADFCRGIFIILLREEKLSFCDALCSVIVF